jgi:hypothetical protein
MIQFCTSAPLCVFLLSDGESTASVFKPDKLSQLPLMLAPVALTSSALKAPNVTAAARAVSLL